ncbi:hypothetical protein P8H27_02085 [Pseudomonas sp. sp1636]|uniref:helix-turn-helix transcriptional regulator n=1 Tax=Pseudomonas sp. sp1636 TaxID=3036707 RepID=UPI0025A6583A|nr:hypothetical protein [Pseudomonas sp. sp1636]MDM8347685.1 hypothetical protein [Pseudomonas sp. sp1636]
MHLTKATESEILTIVEQLYAGILDQAAFGPALGRVAGLLGESHGALLRRDRNHGPAPQNIAAFSNDLPHFHNWLRDYAAHYHQFDPTIAFAESSTKNYIYLSSRMLTKSEQARSTYLQEFCLPNGFSHWMSLRIGDGPVQYRLAIQQTRGEREISDDLLGALKLVMPHLNQALKLRDQNAELRQFATVNLGSLDLVKQPVWIIDPSGRIHFANRACDEDWVHNLMRVDQQRLRPREIAFQGNYMLLLSAACGLIPSAGLMPLSDTFNHRYALHVLPLPPHMVTAESTESPFALVKLQGGPLPTTGIHQILTLLFGFTTAENRISQALMEDLTPEEMAERFSVKVSTVRMQIKSMLGKSYCRRQAELVRLIASFL